MSESEQEKIKRLEALEEALNEFVSVMNTQPHWWWDIRSCKKPVMMLKDKGIAVLRIL